MNAPTSVMVIDDDEDIRNAVRDVLEEGGYSVAMAANGADALGLLREGCRPAVILLDLMMPVMDGYQFVAEKAKQAPVADIPVIVITADGRAGQKALSLGAAAVVRKPFTVETLLDSVEPFRE